MSLRDAVIERAPESSDLADRLAVRAADSLAADLSIDPSRSVVLGVSGGSVADVLLPAIVAAGNSIALDWSRVDVIFADERFAPRGTDDRNATPVMAALRRAHGFDPARLHIAAPSDSGVSLDEAAAEYGARVGRVLHAPTHGQSGIDLLLLGMGPDGHTASLFPGRPEVEVSGPLVIPIRDSPKPPPERVTLTLPTICGARRTWVYGTGAGKRDALRAALGPAGDSELPISRVSALEELILWTDTDALPDEDSHSL